MFCAQCGKQIPEGQPYCRFCGAPAFVQQAQAGEVNREVYLLLAEGNLLRLRKQYKEAEAKCGEVLARYPNSASAHSLMGDLYRDQGRHNDAIEWYKLALDIEPTSRGDREKLQKLLDRVYATGEAPAPVPAAAALPVAEPKAKAEGPVRHLLKASSWPPTMFAAMLAVVALLLIFFGVVLAKQQIPAAGNQNAASPAPSMADFPQPQAPTPTVGVSVMPTAQPKPEEAPTLEPAALPTGQEETKDPLVRGQALLTALRASGGSVSETHQVTDAKISLVESDTATVTVAIPPATDRQAMRPQILSLGLQMAQKAFATDAALKQVDIEVFTSAQSPGGQAAVFAGRLSRDQVATANVGALCPDQQEKLFTGPVRWFLGNG